MTIQDCIDYVDSIEPNAYNNTQKAAWINECEGKVYTQLFLVQPYEYKTVSQALALPAPYDRMYSRYLQAMIHYADGEYNRYQNSYAMFNEVWAEANRWFGGDFDVTDRLRNRSFQVSITPELGDQTILEIPEGCAVAAARLVVTRKYGSGMPLYLYKFTEDWRYITEYCYKISDVWYSIDISSVSGISGGFLAGDILILDTAIVSVDREGAYYEIIPTANSHTGMELDWTCGIQAWVNDSSHKVGGMKLLRETGAEPIPMIMADAGGSTLGVTMGPGFWGDTAASIGIVKLTGRLLIPNERWHYDPAYARRRDARWHG